MQDPLRTEIDTTDMEDQSAVSWAAVAAGGIAAAALTLVLLAFGAGMGFSAISPWSNSGVSSGAFKVGAGIYLIVVAMLSSTVGGYVAGRLRTKWTGLRTDEVAFRDTAHGFLAWGFATVLGAAALGGAATYLVGGAATSVAQGASQGVANSASTQGGNGYFVDMLLRPDPAKALQALRLHKRATTRPLAARSDASLREVCGRAVSFLPRILLMWPRLSLLAPA
jgi:hypothetical protein